MRPPFEWHSILGLSATIEPYNIEGMGSIVYTYSFKDAFRDHLVPALTWLIAEWR